MVERWIRYSLVSGTIYGWTPLDVLLMASMMPPTKSCAEHAADHLRARR